MIAELRATWPEAVGARVLRSRLVIEHRAVISPRPGSDRLRPGQLTPWKGLFLAGDWTQTGWPSTMEGAVRSGLMAAEALLAEQGSTARLRPHDLPIGLLARWLLRIGSGTAGNQPPP